MPASIKLKQRVSDSRKIAFLRKAYKIITVARSGRDSKSRTFCHDVAHSRGQILDNVINTSWFLEAVVEAIKMEATD